MNTLYGPHAMLLLVSLLLAATQPATAQFSAASKGANEPSSETTDVLKREFFDAIRQGDTQKFLLYVPEQGINVGPQPGHLSRADVEQQLLHHRGLYCQLFDSSCLRTPIKLDASAPACSYRELLTGAQKLRTAATETVRNGVRQAILVAEVKNDRCPGTSLIDFIFNSEAGNWKLFSVP